MRTVLIISRYFPPLFDVGGKRAYRFARYLPAHGWRAVIWTAQPSTDKALDPTPLTLPDGTVVHRGYYPAWKATGRRMSDGTTSQPVPRGASAPPSDPLKKLRRAIRWPISDDIWLLPWAASRIAALARQENAEVILASSSPYSALAFGAGASALSGLPLIADLRDPWTLNFLHQRRPDWVRAVEIQAEHALMAYARRVLFTCESAAEAYRAHYPDLPAGHIASITNSFDPSQRPAPPPARSGPIQIVHFGNCYGPRRMETLIRAVALLQDKGQLPQEGVELLNLGRVAQEDLDLARALGVEGCLQFRPVVPYQEGLRILAQSDLQLLLAYGDETMFIPAKFFDYLLTGAPILCLSQPSELTGYLEEGKLGAWVRPDDVQGAAGLILAAALARHGGPPLATPDPEVVQRFSSPQTAASLARVLDEVAR